MVPLQRGHRLQHLDVMNARDATNIMDSTRELIAAGHARQRRRLRSGSTRPRRAGAGGHRDPVVPTDPNGRLGPSALLNELQLGQDSLRVLSTRDGRVRHGQHQRLHHGVPAHRDDNSSYYVLGYYPANERRDGRFRKIEVKVPSRPQARIPRAQGYIAARGRAPEVKPPGPTSRPPNCATRWAARCRCRNSDGGHGRRVQGPQPNGSVVVSTLIAGAALHSGRRMACPQQPRARAGGHQPERQVVLRAAA